MYWQTEGEIIPNQNTHLLSPAVCRGWSGTQNRHCGKHHRSALLLLSALLHYHEGIFHNRQGELKVLLLLALGLPWLTWDGVGEGGELGRFRGWSGYCDGNIVEQLDKMQLINRRVNGFPKSCMFFDGGYISGNWYSGGMSSPRSTIPADASNPINPHSLHGSHVYDWLTLIALPCNSKHTLVHGTTKMLLCINAYWKRCWQNCGKPGFWSYQIFSPVDAQSSVFSPKYQIWSGTILIGASK